VTIALKNTDVHQFDTPIIRQKMSDQVFDRLWVMVQSGELSPGDAVAPHQLQHCPNDNLTFSEHLEAQKLGVLKSV
jgi:hypothetical protein